MLPNSRRRGAYRRQVETHPGHRSVSGGLGRAAVFGMSDGLVSNVSLVIGFAGGDLGASVVRLAGVAGAIAGAISMAAGEWISVSAQNELIAREVAVERRELETNRRFEQTELATAYEGHGMEPATARQAASEVMRSTEEALVVHTREELGVDPSALPSPLAAAGLSLVCFLVGAFVPVVPWMIGSGDAAIASSIALGVVVAAALGTAVGRFADRSRIVTATRQVAILLGACAVTYAIGATLHVNAG